MLETSRKVRKSVILTSKNIKAIKYYEITSDRLCMCTEFNFQVQKFDQNWFIADHLSIYHQFTKLSFGHFSSDVLVCHILFFVLNNNFHEIQRIIQQSIYCQVRSITQVLQIFMKGKFNVYLLLPFKKTLNLSGQKSFKFFVAILENWWFHKCIQT